MRLQRSTPECMNAYETIWRYPPLFYSPAACSVTNIAPLRLSSPSSLSSSCPIPRVTSPPHIPTAPIPSSELHTSSPNLLTSVAPHNTLSRLSHPTSSFLALSIQACLTQPSNRSAWKEPVSHIMTSPQPNATSNNEETLKRLLRDRIAQLESREEDPPRSPDELAAEDAFQVASTAARALVSDTEIAPEEKLRVLQIMFTDCVSNVRALEYDLGLEEKRLSVAELDYSELGEDLRKVESSTNKLKALSRELSKQNKAMIEESERRTAEERGKREEIVEKFDEAMKDINAKLNTDDFVDEEKDDLATSLEADLDKLQAEYDEREKFYEKSLAEAVAKEKNQCEQHRTAQQDFETDELALVTERRKLADLRRKSKSLLAEIEKIADHKTQVQDKSGKRKQELKRQSADVKRLEQSSADLRKAMAKLSDETEELKVKSKETIARVRSSEEELDFWKAKSKSELDKRETLERLCRTLTEERTIMRKEVQAMKKAWRMLEKEIENLRMEINEPERP